MLAVDTNVIVRLLAGDDASQSPRAKSVFAESEVLIATTVLLETEWVLRRVYRHDRSALSRMLRALVGLPNVRLENAERVAFALDRLEAGADFADALHLAAATNAAAFVTFDQALVKASTSESVPVQLL
jgi:predicted nucleic-acid-binding protein